jgi:hypothetical protein
MVIVVYSSHEAKSRCDARGAGLMCGPQCTWWQQRLMVQRHIERPLPSRLQPRGRCGWGELGGWSRQVWRSVRAASLPSRGQCAVQSGAISRIAAGQPHWSQCLPVRVGAQLMPQPQDSDLAWGWIPFNAHVPSVARRHVLLNASSSGAGLHAVCTPPYKKSALAKTPSQVASAPGRSKLRW